MRFGTIENEMNMGVVCVWGDEPMASPPMCI
jgi:hypothetical protein